MGDIDNNGFFEKAGMCCQSLTYGPFMPFSLSDFKLAIPSIKTKYAEAFMDMAIRFGQTSTAERLKVGAILIKNDAAIAIGCNGCPPKWHNELCEGINEDGSTYTLPHVRHAEKACLDKLRQSTETSTGASMFVSHAPCSMCAIDIVSAGIKEVYYRDDYRSDEGIQYLKRSGVNVFQI